MTTKARGLPAKLTSLLHPEQETPQQEPESAPPAQAAATRRQVKRSRSAVEPPSRSSRTVKYTLALPEETLERARNAVDSLAGPPERLTLAALCERGIRSVVDELEKKYHRGKPFPQRPGPLRGGRR